jgi:hypothetical protein
VVRAFAATGPIVQPQPRRTLRLGVTPDEFYQDPMRHITRLYQDFVAHESA